MPADLLVRNRGARTQWSNIKRAQRRKNANLESYREGDANERKEKKI